ncbi:aldehyde dehydrogenase (NADP(+)) [Agromyces sp. CCNWLW203]|uniref:aldehyde dehydrogenase (NADP(+)) n=1 Tax=Agromyces sp. CCNWLW203 TaxID=3112842 RepID=UPI002F968D4F
MTKTAAPTRQPSNAPVPDAPAPAALALVETPLDQVDALGQRAAQASVALEAVSDAERADWLDAIADAIDAARDELVELAELETRLGTARLTGEVARTSAQLRLFALVVRDGAWREVAIDRADPAARPPRPELRRMLTAVGPVAVYSASNFPFAFSVAGGDTASALAAGCPVIVKGHSGHPRLSAATAAVVACALARAGAPDGTFAHISGRAAGQALVVHPAIRAAGFTGSLSGGRALFDLANGRPDPIPFHGELGSVNPVVITRAAATSRGAELAAGLAASFTLGSGQFCTKPGIVFVPEGTGFEAGLTAAIGPLSAGPLLTERIGAAFPAGLARLTADPSVSVIAYGTASDDAPTPVVLGTSARAVAERPDILLEECFGPVTLLARYRGPAELDAAVRAIGGSLTATLHAEPGDDASSIVQLLASIAGRVLFAGWPTGVAVTWSQHHGGPWPASTSTHTSVGATSIRRFLRPIAYQDAPAELLPAPLRDEALPGSARRVDGILLT